MKTKKIEDIKKSIMENNKNINDYPKGYITGDEFEKWLKDKKKDSIEEKENNIRSERLDWGYKKNNYCLKPFESLLKFLVKCLYLEMLIY